jgi:hypothetical protein
MPWNRMPSGLHRRAATITASPVAAAVLVPIALALQQSAGRLKRLGRLRRDAEGLMTAGTLVAVAGERI